MSGCLLGCFKRQQRQRFLRAVRSGDESGAAATLNSHPELAKSVKLHNNKNALHLAVEEGHLVVLAAVVEALCCQQSAGQEGTADDLRNILNGQDAQRQTPLFLACALGHSDCVRFLLANGADRTIVDAKGNLPLHIAAMRGYLGIMFMLLGDVSDLGREPQGPASNVDATNAFGLAPLHLATWARQSAAVQVLLQHGADINVRTEQELPESTTVLWLACAAGTTPLHLAAARGHMEICKILLRAYFERVLEPLIANDSGVAATVSDPRLQCNALGQMPYQVAQRMGYAPLSMVLRPMVPLARLFSDEERNAGRIYGPPSLKTLATEALNRSLAATLHSLMAAPKARGSASGRPQIRTAMYPSRTSLPSQGLLQDASPLAPSPMPRLTSPSGIPLSAARAASNAGLPGPASAPQLGAPHLAAQSLDPPVDAGSASLPGTVEEAGMMGADLLSCRSHRRGDSVMSRPDAGDSASVLHIDEPLLVSSPSCDADTLSALPVPPSHRWQCSPSVRLSADVDQGQQQSSSSQSELCREGCCGGGSMSGMSTDDDVAVASPNAKLPLPLRLISRRHDAAADLNVAAAEANSHPLDHIPTLSSRSGSRCALGSQLLDVASGCDDAGRVMASVPGTQVSGQLDGELLRVMHLPDSIASCDSGDGVVTVVEDAVGLLKGKAAAGGNSRVSSVEEECGVCMENVPNVAVLPCRHALCGTCALKICSSDIQKPSICPFCRALIRQFMRAPA